MAAQEQHFNERFADINFLSVCEEEENSISRQFIEWVINRLELAAKFVENVLPFVNEREEEMAEVAINLRILFHSWCRKLKELDIRNTPNCSHLAIYQLTLSLPIKVPMKRNFLLSYSKELSK